MGISFFCLIYENWFSEFLRTEVWDQRTALITDWGVWCHLDTHTTLMLSRWIDVNKLIHAWHHVGYQFSCWWIFSWAQANKVVTNLLIVHEKQCGNGVTSPSLLVEVKNGKLYIKLDYYCLMQMLLRILIFLSISFTHDFDNSNHWRWTHS